MATYYVDDGGDNSNGQSWVSAYTSVNSLDTAVSLSSGDVVYFGADHQCQATNSADLTITGPTSGNPVLFVSSTVDLTGAATGVSYVSGTGNQIDTTEGIYDIIFNGSFALYGIKMVSGNNIEIGNDYNEVFLAQDSAFVLGDNAGILVGSGTTPTPKVELINCIINTAADTSPSAVYVFETNGIVDLRLFGCNFFTTTSRTVDLIHLATYNSSAEVVGCDFSNHTNSDGAVGPAAGMQKMHLAQCTLPTGVNPYYAAATPYYAFEFLATDCNNEAGYTYLKTGVGLLDSSAVIYRTGGASIYGNSFSWRVNSTVATCGLGNVFYTPWIYGEITASGTKTFSLAITNDTANFTDSEVWLEVQTKNTASSSLWTSSSDQQLVPDNAATQTLDVTSTWNGSGPTFFAKQTLSVASVNVQTNGLYRARVCIAKASLGTSRNFYIDPYLTIA